MREKAGSLKLNNISDDDERTTVPKKPHDW